MPKVVKINPLFKLPPYCRPKIQKIFKYSFFGMRTILAMIASNIKFSLNHGVIRVKKSFGNVTVIRKIINLSNLGSSHAKKYFKHAWIIIFFEEPLANLCVIFS